MLNEPTFRFVRAYKLKKLFLASGFLQLQASTNQEFNSQTIPDFKLPSKILCSVVNCNLLVLLFDSFTIFLAFIIKRLPQFLIINFFTFICRWSKKLMKFMLGCYWFQKMWEYIYLLLSSALVFSNYLDTDKIKCINLTEFPLVLVNYHMVKFLSLILWLDAQDEPKVLSWSIMI